MIGLSTAETLTMLRSPELSTPRSMIVALTLLSAAAMAGQIYLIAKGVMGLFPGS